MEFSVLNVLYDFCIMAALLFAGKVIRAKVRFIQKLYIPSALIAGFLGLFLGKQFLDILPFSGAISSYSGVLIVVLFGSMFLGTKKKVSFSSMLKSVGDTFLVNGSSEIFQFAFFILIGIAVLPLIFKGINPAFGLLLPAGFVGGHGTAAAIGSVLSEAGWTDSVSIGQTFATIGLVFGIICGVILINTGARHGETKLIKDVKVLPEEMLSGLVPEEKRAAFGKSTVYSLSIDPLTWHLALVLMSVGLAYLVNMGLKKILPSISFPTYGLALLCSILVQQVLKIFKLDSYVDKDIVTHIGSSSTDFLVAFGVASINVNVVLKYWIPIVLLSVLGMILVVVWFRVISPRFFKSYWFERGIYIFGMSTGVLATGVILLRICDPDFKSGVLEDFGFAWIFLSVLDMLLVSFSPIFILKNWGLGYSLVLFLFSVIMLAICKIQTKKKSCN